MAGGVDDSCVQGVCYMAICCGYLVVYNAASAVEEYNRGHYLKSTVQILGTLAGIGGAIYGMTQFTPIEMYELVKDKAKEEQNTSELEAKVAGAVATSAYAFFSVVTGYNAGGLLGRGVGEAAHKIAKVAKNCVRARDDESRRPLTSLA